MIAFLTILLFVLGIVALGRIIWVALAVGLTVLWAIPTFLILFVGLGLINAWYPMIIAIIFILIFNKDSKERMKHWM